MRWYTVLQESVVPFESRLVAVLIKPLGITGQVTSKEEFSMVLLKGTEAIPLQARVELPWLAEYDPSDLRLKL
jgi:hypothetical protein